MNNHESDPAYLKGYNEGYFFANYLPDAEQISKAEIKTSKGKGFKDGREEFISEVLKDKLPSWLTAGKTKHRLKQSEVQNRYVETEYKYFLRSKSQGYEEQSK